VCFPKKTFEELIVENIYESKSLDSRTNEFFSNGQLRMIDEYFNDGSIEQTRMYMFENDDLIFAYIAGEGEQNRLYFNNSQLFRWRYTPDINDSASDVFYNDERSNEMFIYWEKFALDEAIRLQSIAIQ